MKNPFMPSLKEYHARKKRKIFHIINSMTARHGVVLFSRSLSRIRSL